MKLAVALSALIFISSCDKDEPKTLTYDPPPAPIPTSQSDPLVGRWDSYGPDYGSFAKWIIIGEDHTFFMSGRRSGNINIFSDKIEFIFADQKEQIFTYMIDQNNLWLLFGNTKERFVKVPETPSAAAACPLVAGSFNIVAEGGPNNFICWPPRPRPRPTLPTPLPTPQLPKEPCPTVEPPQTPEQKIPLPPVPVPQTPEQKVPPKQKYPGPNPDTPSQFPPQTPDQKPPQTQEQKAPVPPKKYRPRWSVPVATPEPTSPPPPPVEDTGMMYDPMPPLIP